MTASPRYAVLEMFLKDKDNEPVYYQKCLALTSFVSLKTPKTKNKRKTSLIFLPE